VNGFWEYVQEKWKEHLLGEKAEQGPDPNEGLATPAG
jgi:hypothetical protein